MEPSILLARAGRLAPMPTSEWEKHLAIAPSRHRQRQAFMTEAHHRVRYFVVEALARTSHPLSPLRIAEQLVLPVSSVEAILSELEANLLFLVRDQAGHVIWAFPLTVEPTPHRITLSTGEALYGA
jgi:hypothetical protein